MIVMSYRASHARATARAHALAREGKYPIFRDFTQKLAQTENAALRTWCLLLHGISVFVMSQKTLMEHNSARRYSWPKSPVTLREVHNGRSSNVRNGRRMIEYENGKN